MNNMNEPLITPQIYLSNLSDCKLSFYTKYHLEGSRRVCYRRPYPLERYPYDRYFLCSDYENRYDVNISAGVVYTNEVITFNVIALDGSTISNVTWLFGDDSLAYGNSVTHSYVDDGNYTVDIIITDIEGRVTKLQATITVLNRPPMPIIDAYQVVNVTLRVAGKKGNIVTMTLLENNTTVGEISVTRETGNPDEQSKTIELRVRGNKTYQALLQYDGSDGGSNPVKLILTVNENEDEDSCDNCEDEEIEINFNSVDGEHQEQTININSTLEELLGDNTMIVFNASKSYDIDGYITNYSWNFGDGTNASGETLIHTYMEDGAYNVTLNITDDNGASANQTISIHLSRLIFDGRWERLRPIPRPPWWPPWWWRPICWTIHYDNIFVEISTDNENWSRLALYPGLGYKNSSSNPNNVNGWVHVEYDLSYYIGQNVSVRFRMKSDSSRIYEGAYIDDILINGTYIGEIPEPPSFNFYVEAFRGSTNITDIYIHLHPLLLEPIANIVDEVKIKLLNETNETIDTKIYNNVDVEYGDTIHFHEFMNCTYINASIMINGETHERKVSIEEIPDITPAAKTGTISETTSSTESVEEPKTASPKVVTTVTIFEDNMECGADQWETSGAVWIGNSVDTKKPYVYDDMWHQTVERCNTSTHSWAYNIEAVKNYDLQDYLSDQGIDLPVRRHTGLLSTKQEIDLSVSKSANLTFYTWWDTESGTKYDKKLVQVSSDHGSFETVLQISSANCPRKQWQEVKVDLSAYCGHKIKIGFRFDTTDTKYNNYEGWYIDDVKVAGVTGATSLAGHLINGNYPPFGYCNTNISASLCDANINENGEGSVSAFSFLISPQQQYANAWVATNTFDNAVRYPYDPVFGFVGMKAVIDEVGGATGPCGLWHVAYVQVILRVDEWDETNTHINTFTNSTWIYHFSGSNAYVPINHPIDHMMRIKWQKDHRYISSIILHAHAETTAGIPFGILYTFLVGEPPPGDIPADICGGSLAWATGSSGDMTWYY